VSVSVVETKNPLETEAQGAELAASLRDGDVVLAAQALGVTDPITSWR
jgi:hypothetical protein